MHLTAYKNDLLLTSLQQFILNLPYRNSTKFCIAFSGGMDSHVLLHVMHQLFSHLPLKAIHVNHGLHGHASKWEAHVQTMCAQLKIPITILNITSQLNSKSHIKLSKGPEDAARRARYAAFARELKVGDYLLTAHHMEDQAETFLVQLTRGAGIQGLASMPIITQCEKGYHHLRPLLHWTYQDKINYAKEHQLTWIEDSSNSNQHFTRNFIRHTILPVLKKRWPSTAQAISRSARHCAEATTLCAEIAEQDLKMVQHEKTSLSIACLLKLSNVRRRNALRYWVRQELKSFPSTTQLEQIEKLLYAQATYQQLVIKAHIFKCYRHYLYSLPIEPKEMIPTSPITWNITQPLLLPWGDTLIAKFTQGNGIRRSILLNSPILTVNFRKGGERFRPSGRIGSHPLKKLYQEWNILPWTRNKIPLLYAQNQLIAVVDYAIAENCKAHLNEPSLSIQLIKNP